MINTKKFQVGDRVVYHYCDGSSYGCVVHLNKNSVRVMYDGEWMWKTVPVTRLDRVDIAGQVAPLCDMCQKHIVPIGLLKRIELIDMTLCYMCRGALADELQRVEK